MNDESSFLLRRVDPATEPPFTIGRLHASPATLELSADGSVETIEMRMMQVLVALNHKRGDAVSRDELSMLCWDGRIVGDDALNRIISRLRKALAADPAIVIDTIPKVGYRLRVDGEGTAAGQQARAGRRWPLLLGLAALVAVVIGLALRGGRDSQWSAVTMQPLTRDPGVEVFPALSPDGLRLAYAQAPDFGGAPDIYIRGTALGEARPLRLTATPDVEISPSWSPDGSRLAFVRYSGRPCEIVVVTPPSGTERVAGRCKQAPMAMIDWLDADTILYSDGPVDGPWRLVELDIASGVSRPLTSPSERLLGDSAPAVSPDGRGIAFRRSVTPGNDDILLLDRRSGEVRPLGIGGWKATGFAWGPDSRTLFLTSNRGGDFGLWAVDTRRKDAPRRISYGILGLGQMSADSKGKLAIEAIRTRANLFAFGSDGKASQLTSAAGNDWDPDLSADGSMVFSSDVSGSPQIWVKRPGEEPMRLTQLGGSYAYAARWSPDGRRIAFIGVDRGRNEIFTIDADGSRLRKLTADGVNKGNLAWGGPSEILYTAEPAGGWRVMAIGGGGAAKPVAGSAGLIILRRSSDGALFGRGLSAPIYRLRYAANRLTRQPTGISVPIAEAWAPSPAGIFFIDGRAHGESPIRFTTWSGQSRAVATLQALHQPGLAVRRSDGALVSPRMTEGSADLLLFELKRN